MRLRRGVGVVYTRRQPEGADSAALSAKISFVDVPPQIAPIRTLHIAGLPGASRRAQAARLAQETDRHDPLAARSPARVLGYRDHVAQNRQGTVLAECREAFHAGFQHQTIY